MQRTSLAPMDPGTKPPSESRRALWVYAATAAFIALVGPSNLLSPAWWQRQPATELAQLLLPASAGMVLGLLFSRDIWNLVTRRNPLWKDLLGGGIAIMVFVAMTVLRESGVWLWSFDSGDALAFALLATMATVTYLTEHTKQVRVYAFARHFAFVHQPRAD